MNCPDDRSVASVRSDAAKLRQRAVGVERVVPPDLGKPGEVPVRTAQDESVLEAERSQMGVADEIPASTRAAKELRQDVGMPRRGARRGDRRKREPFLELFDGVAHSQRPLEHPRIGGDTDEREQGRPWQSDAGAAPEPLLQPCLGRIMVVGSYVCGVDEQVGVDEDQR